MKKDDMRFCIRFNPADPRHRKAAQTLNMAGRRKATIVANALWEYDAKQGSLDRGEVENHAFVSGRASPSGQNRALTDAGSDEGLRNSILDSIGQFKGSI